ncbi:MAG: acyl carrier protein [Acidobacteriota bacterium]
MTKDDVQDIFRSVFNDPQLTLFPEMAAKDVPAWDSFNHLNLILALEDRFGLRFSSEEIAAMANVNDLFTSLNRHGIAVAW